MRTPAIRVVAAEDVASSSFASTRTSRRTATGLVPSPMPESPQWVSSASRSSTPEVPASVVGEWVGQALARVASGSKAKEAGAVVDRRGMKRRARAKSEGASVAVSGSGLASEAKPKEAASRSARVSAARSAPQRPRRAGSSRSRSASSPRGAWIRGAPSPVREAIEAAAVRQARTLLAAPRRTFTRAQIRRAVERTEAEMLPGRARAAAWLAPEAGRRVPPGVRSVGSMREAAPPADVAAFLARAGVPFDPEANPRRRKRRMGAELDRRGGAYVFRVNGIRRAAADRILAGLHAEGLRAASRSASRARSGVLRSRFWELIFPRVVDVAAAARGDADADSPSPEALVEHARRHGAAVAMLYMPGGREGGLHAVALSLVPTPRGRDGLARPGATTFRAAVYDPHGEPTYRRGALEAWLRAGQACFASGSGATAFRGGPARPSIQIRLEHCEGLARAAVQYGREGSCVPGALALIVRLAAMRGNRRGGCARPYQQLLREDAVLAAQLVTWYGVLLRDRV